MTARPAHRLLLLSFLAVAAMAISAPLAFAQIKVISPPAPDATAAPTKPLAYEIVSVRPHGPGENGRLQITADSFTAANLTLRTFISEAYSVTDDKLLVGGPSWIDSATFDINAKLDPADVPKTRLTFRQLADMLQPVLVDRFKLKVHHESRIFPTYNLVLAKGGSKLKPPTLPVIQLPPGQTVPPNWCQMMNKGPGLRSAHNCAATDIASALEHAAGRFVIDKTGLAGKFDFELCYSNERTPEGDPNFNCPTVFTAVQEQLGLKLEPSTAPMDVLVIDSAEQPTPN